MSQLNHSLRLNTLCKVFALSMLSTSLLLSGCGSSNSDDSYSDSANTLVTKTENFAPEQAQENTLLSQTITYKMPAINGGTTTATAVVMIPKGTMPLNGWPIVVWAHGTTGVADKCAPSVLKDTTGKFDLGGALPLVSALVSKGYAVVSPDYEGLGSPGLHPFLNAQSEAESIIYAVKAVKQQYSKQVSNDWMVFGHSQGGHAAIAAAERASEAGLNFKGVVAYAPASHLKETFDFGQIAAQAFIQKLDFPNAIGVLAGLQTFSSLATAGVKQTIPTTNFADVFGARAVPIAQKAESELCSGNLGFAFAGDIQSFFQTTNGQGSYPGLVNNFDQVPEIKTFLQSAVIGKTRINQPYVIVQGLADTTVPAKATQLLQEDIINTGTTVEVNYVANETHGTIITKTSYLDKFLTQYLPTTR